MTKKKRVIVSLTKEAYETLTDLIGVTWNLNGQSYAIDTKSKAIEVLLNEIKEQNYHDKPKK